MQMIVAVLMVLALMLQVDISPTTQRDASNNNVATFATQMAWYHNVASNQIQTQISNPSGSCTPGIVSVAPDTLPPGMRIASSYVSATDCMTMVVSTWVSGNAVLSQAPMKLSGLVAQELKKQGGGSDYYGSWNASTHTVNGNTTNIHTDGSDQTYLNGGGVSVPAGFEGLALTDGIPMMVTRLN